MKKPLSAALFLCLAFAASGFAAEKKAAKPVAMPSTLPPKSPMIALPPADEGTAANGAPSKLISSEMTGRDLQFFTNAVEAGREQAYLVDLLKKRAVSEQIKALGDALSSTQEAENQQIAKVASRKGWNISAVQAAKPKKSGADLETLTGANFDKAAMDKVSAAGQQAINAYQEAAHSNDKDIQAFAAQMLPLAEEKQRLIEKMTGAGPKAASQLFRHDSAPVPTPPVPATPAAASGKTPAGALPKATPVATPPPTVAPSGKATPTPKPAATPRATPAASVPPMATPPGSSSPAAVRPAILPPKTATPSSPAPIPPPVSK